MRSADAALGRVPRAVRERKHLSQDELGHRAGYSRNYIGLVEQTVDPNATTAADADTVAPDATTAADAKTVHPNAKTVPDANTTTPDAKKVPADTSVGTPPDVR